MDESDPTAPVPIVAYLTRANTFFTEVLYTYGTYSRITFDPSTGTFPKETIDGQRTTALLAYGITDDLTVGAELPWSWDSRYHSITGVTNEFSPTTDNPTFFTAYRVLNQSNGPATLFLQSSYSPQLFNEERSAFGIGGAFVRWQSRFAIAGTFEATKEDELTTTGPIQDAFWIESASLIAFVPFDQRWAAALSVVDTLPYASTITYANGFSTTGNFLNKISISPSVTFELLPPEICLMLSYSHTFSHNETTNPYPERPGANVFGIVLSDTALPDEIERLVD